MRGTRVSPARPSRSHTQRDVPSSTPPRGTGNRVAPAPHTSTSSPSMPTKSTPHTPGPPDAAAAASTTSPKPSFAFPSASPSPRKRAQQHAGGVTSRQASSRSVASAYTTGPVVPVADSRRPVLSWGVHSVSSLPSVAENMAATSSTGGDGEEERKGTEGGAAHVSRRPLSLQSPHPSPHASGVSWPTDVALAKASTGTPTGQKLPDRHFVYGTTIVRESHDGLYHHSRKSGRPAVGGDGGCLSCLPFMQRPTYGNLLPPADYLRFCELTKWLQQDFSVDNPAHEKKLQVLFSAAFRGTPVTKATEGHWTRIGFQSAEPSRDFRGGGIAGLDCMVFIAHHHIKVFKRVVTEGNDYGFALAIINLVFIVKKHLRLVPVDDAALVSGFHAKPCSGRVMRHFAHAFASYSYFFHEVICACLEAVHALWMQCKASDNTLTVMQFKDAVLARLPALLSSAFRKPTLTVLQFRTALFKAARVHVES